VTAETRDTSGRGGIVSGRKGEEWQQCVKKE